MRLPVACAAALLALAACGGPAPAGWTRLVLPGSGTLDLREVADCDGRWWVAGARNDPDGTPHPAAWTSADGTAWSSVPFRPLPTSYYGPHQVIMRVACAGGRVVMIGAVPGGAHGNPRVSTWRLAGGAMTENAAPFETYGGERAVDVGRIAAGPRGFAIAGDRTTGAAAWFSADARSFRLVEAAPGLASDAGHDTMARDVVALPDGGWAFAGGAAVRDSLDEQAAVWLTADGRTWTRADPPARTGYNEIQRVIRDGDDLLAAGVRGSTFGLWRRHDGTWTAGAAFGGGPDGVRSLTLAGGAPVVAGGGGLWVGDQRRSVPAPPIAVAGRARILMMASSGALWRTRV